MSQARSLSFGRIYGLARVTRTWNLSRATVYRSRVEKPEEDVLRRRPGPIGACSDTELADHICREIEASEFHGEGYRKIWARLRFSGVRASPRRVRRVRTFRTIEELRVALIEFAKRYNRTWLVARHAYKTPDQVRAEQLSVENAHDAVKAYPTLWPSADAGRKAIQRSRGVGQTRIRDSIIRVALRDFVWVIFDGFHNSGKLQVRILSRR
jgi:hypothetical protein